ncbi:hypothetical protein M436DRAFT_81118 [Aureobasidium namibiae CBS 147.97]|uniref:Extracellular mutant protein 11 C-terminal domain-containing protein n=1 Tax=Aureobasidium namibiae CBS 147.97 TaxID=1043004 RepID=A0A074WKM7_9PEZI
MAGMGNFALRNDHPNSQDADRPATAQKTRDAVEHNGNPVFDTDTEEFDATQDSLDEPDHAASDGSQDGSEHDHDDEQADQGYYQHGIAQLDVMMSQMKRDNAQAGYNNTDSYPPTTSGEPDQLDYSEHEVELDQPQAQSRAKQHRDLTMIKPAQRNVVSTPLVTQTEPPHTQHTKDALKVTVKPTKLRVQHQKSRSKTHGTSQPMAKHAPGQFQTTTHAATTHQATVRAPLEQPDQALRQSARAQIITTDHRPKHINEVGSHHQQYARRPDPHEQHLNNIHPQQHNGFHHQQQQQQQQRVEDLPEEHYEHNTYAEDLDYELGRLYEKDFDDLQNEPFDGPPREDAHDAPSDSSSMPLEERLAAFSRLDVQDQKELFSSLDIEQWEEAGDWFQKRFSEIFDKLKTARRNRRDKASEFEQRIAQRQQAVTKKRKITDDVLSEMKRTGQLVLVGTPKKKQKVTE